MTRRPRYSRIPTNGLSWNLQLPRAFSDGSSSLNRPPASRCVPCESVIENEGRKYTGGWGKPTAEGTGETVPSTGPSAPLLPSIGCLTCHTRPRGSRTTTPGLTPLPFFSRRNVYVARGSGAFAAPHGPLNRSREGRVAGASHNAESEAPGPRGAPRPYGRH